jgi:hypothetical protein
MAGRRSQGWCCHWVSGGGVCHGSMSLCLHLTGLHYALCVHACEGRSALRDEVQAKAASSM